MKDRICILTRHFKKIKVDWRKGSSPLAQELQALMSETIQIENNLDGHPVPLSPFNQNRLAENLANEAKFV